MCHLPSPRHEKGSKMVDFCGFSCAPPIWVAHGRRAGAKGCWSPLVAHLPRARARARGIRARGIRDHCPPPTGPPSLTLPHDKNSFPRSSTDIFRMARATSQSVDSPPAPSPLCSPSAAPTPASSNRSRVVWRPCPACVSLPSNGPIPIPIQRLCGYFALGATGTLGASNLLKGDRDLGREQRDIRHRVRAHPRVPTPRAATGARPPRLSPLQGSAGHPGDASASTGLCGPRSAI